MNQEVLYYKLDHSFINLLEKSQNKYTIKENDDDSIEQEIDREDFESKNDYLSELLPENNKDIKEQVKEEDNNNDDSSKSTEDISTLLIQKKIRVLNEKQKNLLNEKSKLEKESKELIEKIKNI